MSARRFLFALELGGNFGHLTRCLPLARALRAQGHIVLFVVPYSRSAALILEPHQLAYIAAPAITVTHRKPRPPINYADMLLREGYRDTLALQGAVSGWLELFRLFQADCIIADHAPTALLAARIAHLPAAAIGSGFEIPPQSDPLPSMRPWDDISTTQLASADESLLKAINTVLQSHRHPIMQSVTDMLGSVLRVLATFPELDHYGVRPDEYYAGLFYESGVTDENRDVTWPEGAGARILVYMRPEIPGFASLLEALKTSQHRVIFVAPGTHASHAKRFSASNLYFSHQGIDFAALMSEADIAIGYGSIGFTTQALRAGVPQLISPAYVEQQLCAAKVVEMGAGISLADARGEDRCTDAIERLLSEPCYRQAAASFAERYQSYDPSFTMQAVVDSVISQAATASRCVSAWKVKRVG